MTNLLSHGIIQMAKQEVGRFVFTPLVTTDDCGQSAPYEWTHVLPCLATAAIIHRGRFTMLTETEKAYLAGIVDADGCISISTYKSKNGYSKNHSLVVVIGQANGPFLKYWQQKTETGSVHLIRKAHTDARHGFTSSRDYYQWTNSALQAEKLLKTLLPYLDIKKPQAEIALKFRQTKKHAGLGRGRLSSEVIGQRDKYEQEIKALNRKRGMLKEKED